MKTSTKIILIVVAVLVWSAGMLGLGWYIRDLSCVADSGTLEPVGPPHTTPKTEPPKKPTTSTPTYTDVYWNWKVCGTEIFISHKETKEKGKLYTTIRCEDDCKATEQKFQMKYDCPFPKHTIYARLLLGGLYLPEMNKFDVLPGAAVGYIRSWGRFGVGGEAAYSYGLLQRSHLVQGSAIFKYTFN